ncbi:pyridoxal 5-phosphate dependent beta-lyase [Nonomuraea thailandensis]|uniref:Pyridoxal 5-phosphate dependent beta-lyase n=1 Tax=Nonomuraea thailandensis TaxID=1188745 RepID=A0A9X2GL71_9ACTN|nr:aminotransferase class V-fold PLP-dependent enzyme [Nonomuraea thailandensis]MCP2360257.1 pyridoxal 5-phosphate dependent beta-lyase [Nonomuraea thailandensis]
MPEVGCGAASEAVAGRWRAARGVVPPGHLDAAGCNVPSDRVLGAMTAHLRLERERGGYGAVPDLTAARTALAALVGPAPDGGPPREAAGAGQVAFLESGTAAMAALLGGWRLGPGTRVGCARTEYGSTLMLLRRLAARRGWRLVELPVDGDARIDPDGVRARLASGLDLVIVSHVGSHHGVIQPAAQLGALCRAAGVPFVLDVCQSLGHVETRGTGATAYVGTSRKWLAGPRGAGFLIVPDPTPAMDAPAPTLSGHLWNAHPPEPGDVWAEPWEDGGPTSAGRAPGGPWPEGGGPTTDGRAPGGPWPQGGGRVRDDAVPVEGAARYESSEGPIAARAGLGVAVQELHALGPAAVHAHLADLGRTARALLDGAGGWRVAEPLDEPSALVTLTPPPGDTAERAAARAAEASLLVGVVPTARAPLHLREPVLRVSPPPGTAPDALRALARVLAVT